MGIHEGLEGGLEPQEAAFEPQQYERVEPVGTDQPIQEVQLRENAHLVEQRLPTEYVAAPERDATADLELRDPDTTEADIGTATDMVTMGKGLPDSALREKLQAHIQATGFASRVHKGEVVAILAKSADGSADSPEAADQGAGLADEFTPPAEGATGGGGADGPPPEVPPGFESPEPDDEGDRPDETPEAVRPKEPPIEECSPIDFGLEPDQRVFRAGDDHAIVGPYSDRPQGEHILTAYGAYTETELVDISQERHLDGSVDQVTDREPPQTDRLVVVDFTGVDPERVTDWMANTVLGREPTVPSLGQAGIETLPASESAQLGLPSDWNTFRDTRAHSSEACYALGFPAVDQSPGQTSTQYTGPYTYAEVANLAYELTSDQPGTGEPVRFRPDLPVIPPGQIVTRRSIEVASQGVSQDQVTDWAVTNILRPPNVPISLPEQD